MSPNRRRKRGNEEAPKSASRIINGDVEFPLESVNEHITCKLCKGYFRTAYTITECQHSYCRSCIYIYYSGGNNHCPECDVNLGPAPWQATIYDRTLQELVDKILPELQDQDDLNEIHYYEENKIKPKPEFQSDIVNEKRKLYKLFQLKSDDNDDRSDTSPSKQKDQMNHSEKSRKKAIPLDELDLKIIPYQRDMRGRRGSQQNTINETSSDSSSTINIRTSGRLKIIQLKKYLAEKLNVDSKRASTLEILCNGDIVGDELSLTFIHRTRWLNNDEELVLTYSMDDGMKIAI